MRAAPMDVVLTFVPTFQTDGDAVLYDALLFGVGLGAAPSAVRARFGDRGIDFPSGERATLSAVDRIAIHRASLDRAFDLYVDGDRAPEQLRRLFLRGARLASLDRLDAVGGRVRVWLHFEDTDLEELPWELLTWDGRGEAREFVRGLPSRVGPLYQVPSGELRLALLGDGAGVAPFAECVMELGWSFEVFPFTAEAMARAADFDVCHVVTQGRVESASEGALQTAAGTWLGAAQLMQHFRGTRVGLLLLSPTRPDQARTYRAFMHFGQPGFQPSILAPTGPVAGERSGAFWRVFYRTLREHLSVERALRAARRELGLLPICFYLRHRTGQVFTRRAGSGFESASREPSVSTGSLAAQHELLQHTLKSLEALGTKATTHAFARAQGAARALRDDLYALDGTDDDGEDA